MIYLLETLVFHGYVYPCHSVQFFFLLKMQICLCQLLESVDLSLYYDGIEMSDVHMGPRRVSPVPQYASLADPSCAHSPSAGCPTTLAGFKPLLRFYSFRATKKNSCARPNPQAATRILHTSSGPQRARGLLCVSRVCLWDLGLTGLYC